MANSEESVKGSLDPEEIQKKAHGGKLIAVEVGQTLSWELLSRMSLWGPGLGAAEHGGPPTMVTGHHASTRDKG